MNDEVPMRSLVVLPSYNERENITRLLRMILDLDPNYTICVVDDASPDGTSASIKEFMATKLKPVERERVHLIVRPGKGGRGSAVREGLAWGLSLAGNCALQAFVEMDCDFSHSPTDIPRGLAMLESADIVIGCRYPDGTIIGWPISRRVFSFLANILARSLISWGISDYTNGFRFYARPAAELICRLPQRHKGYIYLSETIAAFLQRNYRIRCFPITFINRLRGYSNTTSREIGTAFLGLFEIALRYRFGKDAGKT